MWQIVGRKNSNSAHMTHCHLWTAQINETALPPTCPAVLFCPHPVPGLVVVLLLMVKKVESLMLLACVTWWKMQSLCCLESLTFRRALENPNKLVPSSYMPKSTIVPYCSTRCSYVELLIRSFNKYKNLTATCLKQQKHKINIFTWRMNKCNTVSKTVCFP